MTQKILFNVRGGLGKNILSTAVIEALKKQRESSDIIVITSYPDVFLNNPNIKKVIHHNDQTGIWKRHVFGEDVEFMVQEPYENSNFLNTKKHLIEVWCEMYGIKYNGEKPKIYLSKAEKSYYKSVYGVIKKPILAIQTNGGVVTDNPNSYNWARDMPENLVLKLIDSYKKDYQIVHIKHKNQRAFDDTLQAIDTFRSIAYLLTISKKRLLIDSFAQHLGVAMGLKSLVLWIGTDPKAFGYGENINLKANKFTKDYVVHHNSYQKILLTEPIQTIPYNSLDEIFNFEDIKKNLQEL